MPNGEFSLFLSFHFWTWFTCVWCIRYATLSTAASINIEYVQFQTNTDQRESFADHKFFAILGEPFCETPNSIWKKENFSWFSGDASNNRPTKHWPIRNGDVKNSIVLYSIQWKYLYRMCLCVCQPVCGSTSILAIIIRIIFQRANCAQNLFSFDLHTLNTATFDCNISLARCCDLNDVTNSLSEFMFYETASSFRTKRSHIR